MQNSVNMSVVSGVYTQVKVSKHEKHWAETIDRCRMLKQDTYGARFSGTHL